MSNRDVILRLEAYRTNLLLYRSRFGWDEAAVEARRIEDALTYLYALERKTQWH